MNNSPSVGGKLLLRNARLVLPHKVAEGASLLVEGGRIARVWRRAGDEDARPGDVKDARADDAPGLDGAEPLELGGATVFPGFIDVHIHGAVGVDTLEANVEDLHAVARFLAARGVTAWLPTLVPAPAEDYAGAVESITGLMRTQDELPPAARALGVHYEGPFVNTRQCGALRTRYFRTFKDASDLEDLPAPDAPDVGRAARMMTVAPEVEGGVELISELARRGWVVSIGHTGADVETLERARAAGARHMTHFLNAMSPLHQRAPGPVGWGLVHDEVSVDLIADGVHSDPLMLRLVLRCKTPARVSLISDSVAPAGLGDGRYHVWGETIKVNEGRTSNERGDIAGSVITMLEAVRTVTSLGLPETEVARVASLNPARLLGLEDECGSIEEGKRADLTALDAEGRVRLTLVGGRVAFKETGEETVGQESGA